jgi:hypothetical protein
MFKTNYMAFWLEGQTRTVHTGNAKSSISMARCATSLEMIPWRSNVMAFLNRIRVAKPIELTFYSILFSPSQLCFVVLRYHRPAPADHIAAF